MKLTVAVLLLVAASHAADVSDSSKRQKNSETITEKRELSEGSGNLEKRAPAFTTAPSPVTPGVEYANTKETHADQSPPQQIYATPLPQIAKISDVLTGQGPPFQAAIASHLYAPVSVYQPRLGAPRTYEVSTPIASQLAYSEHKISYQPPQNAIQYNEPLQYNQKLPSLKQPNFVRPINFQQPYQQQLFIQSQPLVYSHQPQVVPAPPTLFQQLPQIPFQVQRPVQYIQNHVPQHQNVQQTTYTQEQQNLVQVFPAQPGVTYAHEDATKTQATHAQPAQRQPESEEQRAELNHLEKQSPPQETYNAQPQGPVSYASFSQSQPAPSFAHPSSIKYQVQPQYEAQPFYQVQAQPQLHQPQPPQPQQLQPQINFQLPPQIQYQVHQNEPSKLSQESLSTASTKSHQNHSEKQISYFRPGPVFPQLLQPQPYHQNSNILPPNPGHGAPPALSLVPTFPPVQYFGKYAQSIFGNYHQH